MSLMQREETRSEMAHHIGGFCWWRFFSLSPAKRVGLARLVPPTGKALCTWLRLNPQRRWLWCSGVLRQCVSNAMASENSQKPLPQYPRPPGCVVVY